MTVFVQELQRIKCKTSNQYNERNEYKSKNNRCFPYNSVSQTWSCGLDDIRREMKVVVSK